MRPRRFHTANLVYRLRGGTEDNDLWVRRANEDGLDVIMSVWEPTEEDRQRIAAGENVALFVVGGVQPPVYVDVTDVPLGRPPAPQPPEDEEQAYP